MRAIQIAIFIILFTIVLSVSASATSATSQANTIRVGIFTNRPIVFEDSTGTPQGIYPEILNEIARHEGWKIEYISGSWPEGLQRLQENSIDLMTSIAYSEQRSKHFTFSQESVLNIWGQVYTGNNNGIGDIFDLKGQKIAILRNGINGLHFKDLLKSFEIKCTFIEVDSYADAAKLAESGKVRACIINNVAGYQLQKEYGIKESAVMFAPFKLLFAAPSAMPHDYLTTIDNYLNHWKQDRDSVYYQILQRWYEGGKSVHFFVPQWLKYTIGISLAIIFVSLIWVRMLYLQINKRKLAEKSMQESQNRFKCLSDAAFEAVIISENGVLIEVNNALCKMLGYQATEILGKDVVSFIPDGEKTKIQDKMRTHDEKPYETYCIHQNRTSIPIEVRGKTTWYKGHQVRVTAIRDLRERKKAEEEKERLIESLETKIEEIQTLRGILPICSFCKNVRNDEGYYEQIEAYIQKHSDVDFSHTICPACLKIHYPEHFAKLAKKI